jgi:hypothetical protein
MAVLRVPAAMIDILVSHAATIRGRPTSQHETGVNLPLELRKID